MEWKNAVDRRNTGSYKWEALVEQLGDHELIYPFSVADNDLPLADALRDGLREHLQHAVLGYTGMTPSYRKAVVNWMNHRHQWTIDPSWIVTSPGVVTALYRCVKSYSAPGDGIVIQTPVYPPFYRAITDLNRQVVANPLRCEQGRYTMDLEDLDEKLSDPRTTMMILCSPHNPVGRVWPPDEVDQILGLCAKHQVTLVSDEIHFDLVRPGFHHTVAASRPLAQGVKVITLTAPSKSFNIAGLQCANIVIADPTLRHRFEQVGSLDGSHGINALGMMACELAYTRCEGWLDAFLELIDQNHRDLVAYLEEHCPQIKATPLEGTYLQWLDFNALGLSDEQLQTFLVQAAHLVMTPGIDFGLEGKGYMRLNLGCTPTVLQEGLVRLKKALDTHFSTTFINNGQ